MTILTTATVRLAGDASGLNKTLNEAASSMQAASAKFGRIGRQLSLAVTAPLALVGTSALKMAADAEEAANKFDVVMGGSADRVRAKLEELSKAIPLTSAEMEGMSASIQDLLVPMGLVRAEAADMSAQMVELAGDLGSFNNVAASRVLEAMKSALAGASEPMRRFGVDTRVARLESLALGAGLIEVGEGLDQTAMAQAVMLAIQQDSVDAMGDATRTVQSFSNQTRLLSRDMRQLAIDIGTVLVPAVLPLVQYLRELTSVLSEMPPVVQKLAVSFAAMASALGPLLVIGDSLVQVWPALVAGFGGLAAAISAAPLAALATGGGLVLGVTLLGDALKTLVGRSEEARKALGTVAPTADQLRADIADAEDRMRRFHRSMEASREGTAQWRNFRRQGLQAQRDFVQLSGQLEKMEADIQGAASAVETLGEKTGDASTGIDRMRQSLSELDMTTRNSLGTLGELDRVFAGVQERMEAAAEAAKRNEDIKITFVDPDDIERLTKDLPDAVERSEEAFERLQGAASRALDQIGGKIGGVVGKLADLGSSFLTGGFVGLGISAGTSLFGSLFGGDDKRDAALAKNTAALDRAANEMAKFGERVVSAGESMVDQFAGAMETLDVLQALPDIFHSFNVAPNSDLGQTLSFFGLDPSAITKEMGEQVAELIEGALAEATDLVDRTVVQDFAARAAELAGNDLEAATIRRTAAANKEIAELERLQAAGLLTAQQVADFSAVISGELAAALDKAAASAKTAARDLTPGLIQRGFQATGQTGRAATAALKFAQSEELRKALEEGIGGSQLDLLRGIQGIESESLELSLQMDRQIEAVQNASSSQLEALDAQRRTQEKQLAVARDALHEQMQVVGNLRRVIEVTDEFRRSLLLSDFSPLSPKDQLEAAQAQFDELARLALGGDVQAGQELPEAAKALLDIGQSYFASSDRFVAIFDNVQKTLGTVQNRFERQLSSEERTLGQLQTQTAVLRDHIASLDAQSEAIRQEAEAKVQAIQAAHKAEMERLRQLLQKFIDAQKTVDAPRMVQQPPPINVDPLVPRIPPPTLRPGVPPRRRSDEDPDRRGIVNGIGTVVDRLDRVERAINRQTGETRRQLEGARL